MANQIIYVKVIINNVLILICRHIDQNIISQIITITINQRTLRSC